MIIASPNIATIHPWSNEAIGNKLYGVNITMNNAVSALNPTANMATFFPFALTRPIVVTNLFFYNGTAAVGNVDIGIYSWDGTKIISSGSISQTGTSTFQVSNITDTQIGPGRFRCALASDSALSSFFAASSGLLALSQITGILSQGSAFPLPANATFASLTSDFIPIFGLTTRGSF